MTEIFFGEKSVCPPFFRLNVNLDFRSRESTVLFDSVPNFFRKKFDSDSNVFLALFGWIFRINIQRFLSFLFRGFDRSYSVIFSSTSSVSLS